MPILYHEQDTCLYLLQWRKEADANGALGCKVSKKAEASSREIGSLCSPMRTHVARALSLAEGAGRWMLTCRWGSRGSSGLHWSCHFTPFHSPRPTVLLLQIGYIHCCRASLALYLATLPAPVNQSIKVIHVACDQQQHQQQMCWPALACDAMHLARHTHSRPPARAHG